MNSTTYARVLQNIYARLTGNTFDCNGLESWTLDTFQGVLLGLDHLQLWVQGHGILEVL